MKQEFSKLEVGCQLILNIERSKAELTSRIVKHLRHNIVLISIDNPSKTIDLNNTIVNVLYSNGNNNLFMWTDATIVCYKGYYLLQVHTDYGEGYNRRKSFRVEFSHAAKLMVPGHGSYEVVVKDISLTGFAIIDELGLLELKPGASVHLKYEDSGYALNLDGNVVRTRLTKEQFTLYGFVITRPCRDLQSYVQTKQRQQRYKNT